MVTVVIADDHPIVRKGLRAVLESESDFEVVGEAEDGLQAMEITERLKPDVLVADVMMPGLSGLEVARQVVQRLPRTRVVLLSMHDNEPYVLEGLRNGALGYVVKATSTDHIADALRTVMQGHRYLSPPITERAIQFYIEQTSQPLQLLDRYALLTNREREVFHLAAEGLTNPEIGEKLHISPRTAETHRTNLMRKLALNSQTDLMKYAIERGVIRVDS
jgi:two-component system, NarL family, response regulator NreC